MRAKTPPPGCRLCSLYFKDGRLCSRLWDDELAELSAQSHLTTLKRGEAVSEDAVDSWPVLAIESGELSLQYILRDGRRTIAAFFLPGDILDLRHTDRSQLGNLIALSNVRFCKLSPRVFDRLVAQNPDARHVVWSSLQAQALRAFTHVADIAKKKAPEKLASFILECRNRPDHQLPPDQVRIPVRRRDLAEYLGMQPETVSRCFRELEARGLIEVREMSLLRILKPRELRLLASGGHEEMPAEPARNFAILRMGA